MKNMITYNGRTSDDPAFGIKSVVIVDRPVSVGTRDKTIEIPGMDGFWDQGYNLSAALIRVQLYLSTTTVQELRNNLRSIAAWLSPRLVQPLIFADEPNKQYYARRTGEVRATGEERRRYVPIEFVCPSPFAWSTTVNTAGPNNGTAETPCIITCTVTQQTESLRVRLVETGQFVLLQRHEIYWPVTLQAGDIVTIDTARELTLVNGVDARAGVNVLSDYFQLPPGQFTITTEPAADMQIEFRERW